MTSLLKHSYRSSIMESFDLRENLSIQPPFGIGLQSSHRPLAVLYTRRTSALPQETGA